MARRCRALAPLFAVLILGLNARASSSETILARANGHWAFQPVKSPPLPAVKNAAWCRNSIDYFVLAELERAHLEPAPAADKRTLIRRAAYDLTGLPPSFAEVEAFIADTSSNAFEKVVDRLLASTAYGEHWGRHWLDVVRYADTAGETADYPVPSVWHYRNYVIDAFNHDKPYNEFVREQVAGDILARQGPREKYAERVTATGFIALSRRFGYDSENYRHLTIQDTLDTLGQSILGLSIGCARCHDHKFDPIPNEDYYALYGIFESTRYAFPGSEQKQRVRALVPLVPIEESRPKWKQFESRVAVLENRLKHSKTPPPAALLRSLDEMDGDFEFQAPAAGGSLGVLVAPWVSIGDVSVTAEAQSPYKNVYADGKSGVTMSASSNANASFFQALHLSESRATKPVFMNLDFKIEPGSAPSSGTRRLWIGSRTDEGKECAAFELIFSAANVTLRSGDSVSALAGFQPNEWQNLQLTIDGTSGSLTGRLGTLKQTVSFSHELQPDWNGCVSFIAVDSSATPQAIAPKMLFDNFAVQDAPVTALSSTPRESKEVGAEDRLRELVGMDGDLEFQTEGLQPSDPWYPGPGAKAKLGSLGQSPFRNIYPAGQLGVQMENSADYDGFVQKLAHPWKAAETNFLHASFDFQCASRKNGGEGSWRFYLGQGAGASAAVELYITGDALFARSAQEHKKIASVEIGKWYQVQLALDLKEQIYWGSIGTPGKAAEFSGKFAPGWTGVIDHLFIDSYGHVGGARPSLFVDNFAIGAKPYPECGAAPVLASAEDATRREKASALRNELAEIRSRSKADLQELEKLLTEGPFELAYGVVEGTPRDVPIQMRGEPDKPGRIVHRGFLSVLSAIPARKITGSGRLELADWLVDPRNPLTPRVMANRIWEYHFGRGIVETPNDFGIRGQHPSHPELLDYLATYFMEHGWSIKAMHRLILLSAAYQQSCSPTTDLTAAKLYRGVARRRLTAEELRDSILLASAELDRTPGADHPFPAPFTWSFSQHGPFTAVYENEKRSVYQMRQRIKGHPFLSLFDCADPNASVAERRVTTVPTQALFFLNDPFVHRNSEVLARRLIDSSSDNASRVEQAFRVALSRAPSAIETADGLEFIAAYEAECRNANTANPNERAFAALARTLFASNEFIHID